MRPVSKLWMPPRLMARCAEHPNIIPTKRNTSDCKVYKTMSGCDRPGEMTLLCGLRGPAIRAYTAPSAVPVRLHDANFAPSCRWPCWSRRRLRFPPVRDLMVEIAPLYEFAGICAATAARDPGFCPDYTAGHIYVGVLKAPWRLWVSPAAPCGNRATI